MNEELGVSHAFGAGVQNARASVAGASYGAQRMLSDMGNMIPKMPSPNLHPYLQARHGMYAHEMSFTGNIQALYGEEVPETTTSYEFQELAARDLGNRVGSAVTATGLYGGAAAATWKGGEAAIGAGWKYGKKIAKSSRAATKVAEAVGTGGRVARMTTGAMGVAGGLAGVAGGMLPLMAVEAGVSKIAGDLEDRQDVTNFLEASSFRYATGAGEDIDERFGAGFNRKARSKIASDIKAVDLQDSSLDMTDLKGILESGTELGLFDQVRDAEEFSSKFKDLTESVKKVTRTLHTTLAEGMKTIKDLKEQGFEGSGQITEALMTADVLGTASGKTAAEMLAVGRQGSEMVRGTGVAMSTGSTMLQNTTSMVGQMSQSGALSQEMVRQAGGEGRLAQGMMASSLNFMRSGFGRGAMIAATGSEGNLDIGAVKAIASGETSLEGMVDMAAGNMDSPGAFVKQFVNRDKNMRQLGKEFGDMGIQLFGMGANMTAAKSLAGQVEGLDMDTAMRFQMGQQGMSESQIEAQMGMLENVDEFKASQNNALRVAGRKAQGEIIREKFNITGRIGDKLDRAFAPVSAGVGNVMDRISGAVTDVARGISDDVRERVSGISMVETEGMTRVEAERALLTTRPELKAGGSLAASNFTDQEAEDFRETKRYQEIRMKTEGRENSEAANNAGSADEYAKAVFGRTFGNLTRDERVFLKGESSRTGRTDIEDDITERQGRAQQALRNRNLGSVEEIMAKKEEAEQGVESARMDIIDKLGGKGDSVAGMPVGVGMRESFENLDEEGKAKFDELIMMKAEFEKDFGENADTSDPSRYSKADRKRIDKMEQLKGDIAGQMRRQGGTGAVAANQFLENIDEMDTKTAGGALANAKDVLEGATNDARGVRVFQSAAQSLADINASELDSFMLGMGGDKSKFKKGVSQVRELLLGERESVDDMEGLSKLAKQTSHGGLSRALTKASRIDEPLTDMKEIRSTLGVGDEITDEEVKGYLGGDQALSKEELLKFELGRNMSDLTGNPEAKNTDYSSGSVGDIQRETVKSLVDTQDRIANVTEMLEALASRLERQVGR